MIGISGLTFKLILVSWITAKRQLIHDRTASRNTWNQNYDFIVVGGGTAGCVVAARLAENPKTTVLLLEAGGAQDAIWSDIHWLPDPIRRNRLDTWWQYYDEPLENAGSQFPDGRINEWMGRILGGSSSIGGMTYNRGNRRDYDNWVTQYGAFGWSYDEVLPYFMKSENNTDMNIVRMNPDYHGIRGPIRLATPNNPPLFRLIQQSYNNLGFPTVDFNGPSQRGVMLLQQTIDERGLRISSANAYIDPNPYPNNLHIITRALVIRILSNNTNAIGVQFARNDTSYNVYARREVILCAGAYNSPQILMLSGIGIKSHLQRFGIPVVMELPVGNNFMNHPVIYTSSPILSSSLYFTPEPQLTLQQLTDRYFNNSGPLGYFPLLDLYFSTESQTDKSYPNILCENDFPEDGTQVLYYCSLMLPRSKGTIRLQSSSPYILPRIDPNYLAHPSDFQDAVEAARFLFFMYDNSTVAPYLRTPSFEDFGCQSCPGRRNYECDEGLQCFIRQNVVTNSHPGGSCRMGDVNRNDVVVDPLLRVKNINRLRICDASIFPMNPNANQMAPVIMIGEKCAQIIKDCYQLEQN